MELYPYQKEGVEWLKTKRFALLADEMGLGKSAQVIVASDQLIDAATAMGTQALAAELSPLTVVLCPAVARFNWANEFTKFSQQNRNVNVVLTRSQLLALICKMQNNSTIICSYDLASVSVGNLAALKPDTLILDEVHYLKNPQTQRAQAVFGKEGIARHAARVWTLSGTPAPNHAGELWVLLRCFGATSLGYDAYISRYCDTYWTGHEYRIAGTKKSRIPELNNMLKGIMLRRRKREVMSELGSIVFSSVTVEPVQYGRVPEDFARCETMIDATADDALSRLSVSAYRRHIGMLKVAKTAELVNSELELGLYSKIVIFGHHIGVLEGMKERLKQWQPVLINGSTMPKAREAAIQKFQFDPECRVFIGNMQAVGTGINLTAASNVLMLEPDWVPGNNSQAIARCHRIGQTEPVMVRFVELAGDSLDKRIMGVVARKTRELSQICGD
jgi:SWI/SNF-related matrix-associated actin-dependent regulator 1 of chromatin subfamily A